MGTLLAAIESCLRHDYTILVEEVFVLFIPLVPVYAMGSETSAEGVQNIYIFRLISG